MPIKLWWHDEAQSILYAEFDGTITLDEYLRADDEMRRLLGDHDHAICAIIDHSRLAYFPAEWGAILNDSRARFHPRFDLIVLVDATLSWEMLNIQLCATEDGHAHVRRHYRLCASVDEAEAVISDHRRQPKTANLTLPTSGIN